MVSLMIKTLYKMFEAYKGWWLYHRIIKKYQAGNTKIVLMPSFKWEYNYYALLYLDQMILQQKYDSALLLAVDKEPLLAAKIFSKKILATHKITRKQAKSLLQFYCLYDFDPRFVVASLDEPEGRNGSRMIGKNGTTIEQMFAVGVYKIPNYKKEKEPVYCGNNKRILHFLKSGITVNVKKGREKYGKLNT